MEKLVFLLALASLSVAQQYVKDPKEAAILSEKRYLSNNGQFGSAYTQEDGVQFTEESDEDGNRRGAYSYIDPNGQRRTITYTAGKNGFQASGDHIPVAPAAPPAPAQPSPAREPVISNAPVAQSAPRQFESQSNTEEGQYHPIYDDVEYWQRQKSRASSAPAQGQWSSSAVPASNPAPAQSWSAPASPAPEALWRAQAEPTPAPQWRAPAAPAPVSEWTGPAEPAPAPQWRAPAPAAPAPQWRAPAPAAPAAPAPQWRAAAPASQWSAPANPTPAPQWNSAPRAAPQSWEVNTIVSTEAPHRFFPPGKLDLNRSPDGFSYSFSKD